MQADWLWSLKDWIDHKWMAMYGPQLANMADTMRPAAAAQRQKQQQAAADAAGDLATGVVAAAAMRCAGCASKVSGLCVTAWMTHICSLADMRMSGVNHVHGPTALQHPKQAGSKCSAPHCTALPAANVVAQNIQKIIATPRTQNCGTSVAS